ncbi:MAG TPA: T9SS type A sorting domain-containing protein [Prolixibacteraceae bacterium]|nr:T9SS type A sorting domain-containing protein [Prolixibacteraceae bacterium]
MVYDFQVGDELHTFYEWSECCNKGDSTKIKTKLKYLERLYAKDSIVYMVEREESIYKRIGKWDSISYVHIHDTLRSVYKPDSLFDKLPGEPIISENSAYTYRMINENPVSKRDYSVFDQIIKTSDSCWSKIAGEACFAIPTFLKGLGGPYYSCENPEGAGGGESNQLVYYKKGSTIWGTPLVITGVKSLEKEDQLKVYPNPAADFVILENISGRTEKYILQVLDLQGREVLRNTIAISNSSKLDLSAIKEGAYLLKLQNGEKQFSSVIVKKR